MPLQTSQIPCSPNSWLLLYSVWDPGTALYTDKLESLQDFATKCIIMKQLHTPYDDCLRLLYLPWLSIRCMRHKLSLCYRIVTSRSIVSSGSFFYTLPVSSPAPQLYHLALKLLLYSKVFGYYSCLTNLTMEFYECNVAWKRFMQWDWYLRKALLASHKRFYKHYILA